MDRTHLDLDFLLLRLGLLRDELLLGDLDRDLDLDLLFTGDLDLFFTGDLDLFLLGDLDRDLECLLDCDVDLLCTTGDLDRERFLLTGGGDFDLAGDIGDSDCFRGWELLPVRSIGDALRLRLLLDDARGESSKRYFSGSK